MLWFGVGLRNGVQLFGVGVSAPDGSDVTGVSAVSVRSHSG